MKDYRGKIRTFIKNNYKNILFVSLGTLFLIPIAGVFLGFLFSKSEFTKDWHINLYMFGLDNLKDFYSFWITLFGVPAIGYNIYQNQKRITIQNQQLDIQTKEQREERFTKGVELLGSTNESIRIGGVHILYYLAKDFEKEYRKIICNMFCSHIITTTKKVIYQTENKDKPSNEINTILELLLSNTDNYRLSENLMIKLSGSYLRGCELDNIDLSNSILENVDFSYSKISSSNFSYSICKNVNFTNCKLSYIKFYKSDLRNSHLNIHNSSFQFEELLFDFTNLSGAELENLILSNIVFNNSDLTGAHFINCNLEFSTFNGSVLNNAIFTNCKELDISHAKERTNAKRMERTKNPEYEKYIKQIYSDILQKDDDDFMSENEINEFIFKEIQF